MFDISQRITLNTTGDGCIKTLLVDTDLVIAKNKKYGLVGINGSGKTTLLKYIATTFDKMDLFMVEQEANSLNIDESVIEYILSKNVIRKKLFDDYNAILQKDKHTNNNNEDMNRTINSFSGE